MLGNRRWWIRRQRGTGTLKFLMFPGTINYSPIYIYMIFLIRTILLPSSFPSFLIPHQKKWPRIQIQSNNPRISTSPPKNSPWAVPSSTVSSTVATPPAPSPSSSPSPAAARPSSASASASSLFIHTEFPFPFRRLRQVALSLSPPCPDDDNDPCDRIFIHAANSAADLLNLLDRIDTLLLAAPPPQQPPIRLIVIDSIAALFRSEFDNSAGDLRRRSLFFFKISGNLKAQAARFGVAVVVTNQVVDLVDEEGSNGLRIGNYEALYSSGRRVCPALGLAWANCVNSRVFLSRSEESIGTRRRMRLCFLATFAGVVL